MMNPDLQTWLSRYVSDQHRALDSVDLDGVSRAIELVLQTHRGGHQIFLCGNGGNAANASHFVTDLGKNASASVPAPFRVLSINDNCSWMTAIGNDYCFDDIYLRQLRNFARAGDLLICSSVSGNSPNLVRAVGWAREEGLQTLSLVGANRGRLAELSEHVIVIEDAHYGRVEDVQMHIFHMLCYAFVEKVV